MIKNITGILIAGLFAVNVYAQNPANPKDTLIRPHRTDSLDFKSRAPKEKQRDTSNYDYERNNSRKDSLPLDDRKPRH